MCPLSSHRNEQCTILDLGFSFSLLIFGVCSLHVEVIISFNLHMHVTQWLSS